MKVNVSVVGLMHAGLYGLPESVKSVEVECDFHPGYPGTRECPPEPDDVDNVLIPELADWQEDALIGDDEFFTRLVTAAREHRDEAMAEDMASRGL